MKKQKIQMLILCLLLFVLVGVFFVLRNYNNRQSESDTEEVTYTVLTLEEADVKAFSFSGGSETVSLEKQEDEWIATEEPDMVLEQDSVTSLLNYVLDIQAQMQIEAVTDFAQYGFDDPLATVTLTLQDGTVYEIVFGHYNEITAQYYMKLENSDAVYILSDNLGYHFQISLEDLKKVETQDTE